MVTSRSVLSIAEQLADFSVRANVATMSRSPFSNSGFGFSTHSGVRTER
jgi:hypothetical protein